MMSALNRQASKSTELLHVSSSHESSGGARRSWDSLVTDKSGLTGSPDGFNHEKPNRARFSVCSSGPALTPSASGHLPWFGGSLGGDQSPRILGTMPRNVVALLDRPVTYEEELEDRMGLLKVSATTLYQRLSSEKKKGVELTQQLHSRERNYRGTIEKIREQHDQRFERLKNRARLLVTRCEFLRNEKQLVEQMLAQVIESTARERQGMERKISALQEEMDRMKNETVTSGADDDDIEEASDLPVLRVTEENDDLEKEKEGKVEMEWPISGLSNERSSEHFKMLCEIAVAKVAFLEHWIVDANSSNSTAKEDQFEMLHPLSRRSSSCPMIAVSSPLHLSDNKSFHSNGNQLEEPRSTLQVAEADFSNPDQTNHGEDFRVLDQTILRVKSYPPTSGVPSSRPLANTRSMPPTIGYTIPILPSTIRTSLHKLFHSGKSSRSDIPSAAQDARISLTGRIESPSDEEFPKDISIFDAKLKRQRPRSSKREKCATLSTPTKRHSSLPRNELLRKFQYGGKHEKESQSLNFYPNFKCATLPQNSAPLTKQERVLGIRLDRSSADNTRFNSDFICTSDFLRDLPATRLHSKTDNESTESLPEKVKEFVEEETKTMKRNRSVHSTFGRLHQRRNGIANIGPIEQKTSNHSAFDNFGKNLKHYLH